MDISHGNPWQDGPCTYRWKWRRWIVCSVGGHEHLPQNRLNCPLYLWGLALCTLYSVLCMHVGSFARCRWTNSGISSSDTLFFPKSSTKKNLYEAFSPHPVLLSCSMPLLGVWEAEAGGGRMGDGCMKCPIRKVQLTDGLGDWLNTSHKGSGR